MHLASTSGWPPEISVLLDFIATDERPTFVLRLPPKATSFQYRNKALSNFLATATLETSFESWISRLPVDDATLHHTDQKLPVGLFGGASWSLKSLASSYIVVSSSTNHVTHHDLASNGFRSRNTSTSSLANDDSNYLLQIPQLMKDPYATFFTRHPWHETPVGAINSWHPVLREFVAAALVCPSPRVLYWGSDACQIYNEAAVPIIGGKHPFCLGRSLETVWGKDIADQVSGSFTFNSTDLKRIPVSNAEHVIERMGYTEEAFFTYTPLPMCSSNGTVLGHMIEVLETTATVLMKERADVKQAALDCAELMTTSLDVWPQFMSAAKLDEAKDICYAMLFGVVESIREAPQASDHAQLNRQYCLQHSFGFPDEQIMHRVPELFAGKLTPGADKKIFVLQNQNGDLPCDLAIDLPDRGKVNTICVFRIDYFNGHRLGFVVLGMNPRRRFDEESRKFVQSLRDIFARRTALLSRPDEDREDDMVRMYRDAPIGLFKFRPDGHPVFINDAWLEIFGLDRKDFEGPSGNFAWAEAVHEDDKEAVVSAWEHLVALGSGTWEFRTKVHGPDRWIEARCFPEIDEAGKIMSVYGWLSDISHRKLTETLMTQRLSDALETKNAAVQFIDIVSHEMRNPLSSILQLTDSILSTVKPEMEVLPLGAADLIVDAADTINLCAQHQKTIVDDILTLSKLDSKLVVLSPDVVQVQQIIRKAMRMVEVDLSRSKIETSLQVDKSCTELGVDYVSLDSGRLLQILLNLLTNAIKFTQHQLKTRRIWVSLNAYRTRPDGKVNDVHYIEPRDQGNNDTEHDLNSISDDDIWLEFSVADTGLGMTEEETTHLFYRFSQASPKTYKQYGGSGLGLFICRELAELHGGQIGFRSEYGMGTKFAFYIKAKRSAPPRQDPMDIDGGPVNGGSVEHQQPIAASIKDLHILIVEDNAINQRVMAQQLRRTGCSVDVADNGEEALQYLATTVVLRDDPDALPLSLILMDIEMPVMDGLTCTRQIRDMEASGQIKKHLPVTGITANSRQEQIAMAQEAGMDDVVTKPFRISELVPRVEALATKWSVFS